MEIHDLPAAGREIPNRRVGAGGLPADELTSLPTPAGDHVSLAPDCSKPIKPPKPPPPPRRELSAEPSARSLPELPRQTRVAFETELGNAGRSLLYDTPEVSGIPMVMSSPAESDKRAIDRKAEDFNRRPENAHRHLEFSELEQHVRQSGKFLVAFSGFSDSSYQERENVERMLAAVIEGLDPQKDMVLSFGSETGIGVVSRMAHERGIETVAVRCRDDLGPIPPYVDRYALAGHTYEESARAFGELASLGHTVVVGGNQFSIAECDSARDRGGTATVSLRHRDGSGRIGQSHQAYQSEINDSASSEKEPRYRLGHTKNPRREAKEILQEIFAARYVRKFELFAFGHASRSPDLMERRTDYDKQALQWIDELLAGLHDSPMPGERYGI